MKVLHLLAGGEIGGIEILIKDICQNSGWDNHVCLLLFGGPVADEMKQSGIPVFDLHGGRLLSLKRLVRLVRLCRTQQYDIINVHHEGAKFQFYYIMLMRLLRGTAGVMTLHSCFEEAFNYRGKNRIAGWLIRRSIQATIRRSQLIIGVSKAAAASYRAAFKIDAAKTAVVYNGVGEALLEQGRAVAVDPAPPLRLLYVGRVVAVKGIENLIEAVCQLRETTAVRLVIVGDGGEREHYEALTVRYGLADTITFAGYDRDVAKYYAAASCFVYPSVWEEAFGISIIEAMCFGLPAIVNRKGGMPEIVEDGLSGFITSEPTARGLADAIRRAAAAFADGEAAGMSQAAKARAADFSIRETVDALEAAYRQLLGQRQPATSASGTGRDK